VLTDIVGWRWLFQTHSQGLNTSSIQHQQPRSFLGKRAYCLVPAIGQRLNFYGHLLIDFSSKNDTSPLIPSKSNNSMETREFTSSCSQQQSFTGNTCRACVPLPNWLPRMVIHDSLFKGTSIVWGWQQANATQSFISGNAHQLHIALCGVPCSGPPTPTTARFLWCATYRTQVGRPGNCACCDCGVRACVRVYVQTPAVSKVHASRSFLYTHWSLSAWSSFLLPIWTQHRYLWLWPLPLMVQAKYWDVCF